MEETCSTAHTAQPLVSRTGKRGGTLQRGEAELLDRLSTGPSFLLVGQAWPSVALGGPDLVATALAGTTDERSRDRYDRIVALSPEQHSRFIEALARAGLSAAVPDWFLEVADFPWNGAFTTAIDGILLRTLDADWRRVVPVVGRDVRRQPRRNPTELRVSLLFGGAGLPEDSLPPQDRLELAARRGEARALLGDLAEGLLTPRGVLVVEGYAAEDWLGPEDLYALISQLLPGQVHLFSTNHDLAQNEFIAAAVDTGHLITHTGSLADFMSAAGDAGRLVRPPLVQDVDARFLRVNDRTHAVPRDVWNGVVSSARPIDLSLLVTPPAGSAASQYQRFRSFLDGGDGPAFWSGLAASYNFQRTFEPNLWQLVIDRLRGEEVPDPVIVAGQSGSGKTVALAALARAVALDSEFAVLHVPRRSVRPQIGGIDDFALWAESIGARGTLLVWDGMLDTDDYFALARQLRSRGRKALIVGSTYRSTRVPVASIHVPGQLDAAEATEVESWLAGFGISIAEADRPLLRQDASFLAALYRLLPESRREIRRGLVLELRSAEDTMERRSTSAGAFQETTGTVLADALRRAGLVTPLLAPAAQPGTDESERVFADRSTTERLTNMVVAAGQHDVNVPLELILRSVGREGAMAIVELIKQIDIIRWYEDENGEQALGLRTSLEGQILAEAEFASSRVEWEAIAELFRELRPRPGWGGPEVQFAVDLVQRIGPQSDKRSQYLPAYLIFAEALREARLTTRRDHPRLLLAEANLAREFAKWSQSPGGQLTSDERLEVFRNAEHALETALELEAAPQTRLNLLTELASNLGSQLYESMTDGSARPDLIIDLVARVLARVQEARTLDPTNYYPVDVMGWVARAALEGDQLAGEDRVRILADAAASFESVDRDLLTPRQAAMFDSRSVEMARLLEDPVAAEEHLALLERNNDPAAFYLLALRESAIRGGAIDPDRIGRALARLRSGPPEVRRDWRCARLTVDLFWMQVTGRRLLGSRGAPLHLPLPQWEETLQLVSELAPYATFDRYRLDFLRALALFHLGRYQQADDAFRDLDRATANLAQRIQTSFVEANSDLTPASFTGQVQSIRNDQMRGTVWVDRLRVELPFLPRRFTQEPLTRGDPLPEFVIEFNYRGPYAFPARTVLARQSNLRRDAQRR